MRCHVRLLPVAAYHVSLRHPASFLAGKTWGAGPVMAWVQKHTAVAARGREAVRGVVAALLEVVAWQSLRAAEAQFAACVAPAQSDRKAETGKRLMHTERAVLVDRDIRGRKFL